MFTTSSEIMERKYCQQLGADAFLTKPVNYKDYTILAEQLSSYLH
jgi:CheY-like chemotaxis protein